MPTSNTWMTITVQIPFWGAILILMGLIAVGVGLGFYLRRRTALSSIRQNAREGSNDRMKVAGLRHGVGNGAYQHFIYNISHEVSNPLQSIQTNLENMASCTPEEEGRRRQYHEVITTEIRRLGVLTGNLRLLSHLETPEAPVKREAVNIKGVIEGVMMSLVETAESRGVRLIYSGPERPARVLGDRDHLQRVLINLVDNGIKYSQDSGGEVIISVQEQGERLLVRVIDNGIGISAEDLPYVFDTAYQAPRTGSLRKTGSGLGLAIVKRIVEQHGGDIHIQSTPGRGTTAAFDLPLYIPS